MNPKELQKLARLAQVLDKGDIALLTELDTLESRLEGIEGQLPALQEAKDGDRGEKGEKGDKGESIVGPMGPAGRDGRDGKDSTVPGPVGPKGEKGDTVVGPAGKDGKDGRDGKDGFIDVATIGYLEDEIKKLEKKHGGYGKVIRELRAGTGVTIDNSNMEYPVINATGGSANWTYYATTWSVEPTLNTSITGGDVYNYTLDGVTRYRFVPTVYDATEDAFYSTFSNPTLSGLIVTRG